MAAMAMQMPTMGPSPATHRPCGLQSQNIPVAASGLIGGLSLGLPPAGTPNVAGQVPLGVPPQHGTTSSNSFSPGSEIGLLRVKLADILPEEGEPSSSYLKAVEAVSSSLARANAVILELNSEDAKLVRCALQSAKLYLRNCVHSTTSTHIWGSADWNKTSACRDSFLYRAGRSDDQDPPPPCMPDAFRCMGKASRAALSVIARYLRLRADVFQPLLDDCPLPPETVSSSYLTASLHHNSTCGKGTLPGDCSAQEVEKGLLMLIASDAPGLLVNDSGGHWYTADTALSPGDLLLLAGRALHQATAGLRRPSTYRVGMPGVVSVAGSVSRTSLAFKLMPRPSASFDISALSNAGHAIPEGYGPITVAQFMDGLSAAEALMGNSCDSSLDNGHEDGSLKVALSDPGSGMYLEDAMLSRQCGHSFGGTALQRANDTLTCSTCGMPFEEGSLIPNFALRAAACAYKREEINRIQSRAKRRRENGDIDNRRRVNRDNAGSPSERDGVVRVTKGVQYPFKVNERVKIKGNKRTPEKFVGREAIITSQCLNGWYLVRTLDSNESVRLQYRSLQASSSTPNEEPVQQQAPRS